MIVFPQAHENHWSDGRKYLDKGIDDVAFSSKFIDYFLNNYQNDKQKIDVVGFSNGGYMSIRLAIELPDKFGGIAVISAQLSDAIKNKKMKSPASFLLINSTQDSIVPY